MRISARKLTRGAVIGALYAALTLLLAPISFSGAGQIRLSEALCVLPFFTPDAIAGLAVGCLLSNLIAGCGIWDVVIGTAATALAALWTARIKKTALVPFPTVLCNTFLVGPMLHFVSALPLWMTCLSVFIGEAAALYGLGLPLVILLKKRGEGLFR